MALGRKTSIRAAKPMKLPLEFVAGGALYASAVLTAAMVFAPSHARAEETTPLRLCADPANLPFSSDDPAKPGLYVEIGNAVAKAIGRPAAPVWYRTNFGNRSVRVTMLAGQCDATVGLPDDDDFMGPKVIYSKPLMTLGYAVVTPKGKPFASLGNLVGKRVAVQYQTTPQNLLAMRDDITKVTVLSPEEGLKALQDGRADAAFIWGPVAGFANKNGAGYEIVSVDGPALRWPTSIGFAKTSGALRDQVDAALPALATEISALMEKYGFPSSAPVKVGAFDTDAKIILAAAGEAQQSSPAGAAPAVPASDTPSAVAAPPVASPAPVQEAHAGSSAATLDEGKEIFNGTCAHCHGPNAEQSVRKIDLRLLEHRYGADMKTIFWKTVHEGRPAKGMPAWGEVFTDEQFDQVFAWLQTIQTKDN